MALLLQRADQRQFGLRVHAALGLGDAQCRGNALHRGASIAAGNPEFEPLGAQSLHGAGGIGPEGVDQFEGRGVAGARAQPDALVVRLFPGRVAGTLRTAGRQLGNPSLAADTPACALLQRFEPEAADLAHLFESHALARGCREGRGQGMRGVLFQAGGQRQRALPIVRAEIFHGAQLHALVGQRAGLVEHHGIDCSQPLERAGARDQHAAARQARGGRSNGHRRGERKRAGAGDHQHGQRGFEGARRVDEQPAAGHHQRQRHDPEDEVAGGAIGCQRLGRALGLRALDQRHHVGERRLARGVAGDKRERRAEVDGATGQHGADAARDRHRLARDQRLVDQGEAFAEHAVHRHNRAARHQQAIAGTDLLEGHLLLAAARVEPSDLARKAAGQRLAGIEAPASHVHLDVAADQQEEHEHRHRVEVDLALVAHGVDDTGGESQHQRRRHRRIHPQAPATQVVPRALEEWRAGIEQHRHRQQHARDTQQFGDPRVDAGKRAGIQADRVHGHLHGHQAREPDALLHAAPLAPARDFSGSAAQGHGLEAQALDLIEYARKALPGRVPGHAHARGRQVDINALHAGQGADLAAYGACAVGAVHALGKELRLREAGAALPMQVCGGLAHGSVAVNAAWAAVAAARPRSIQAP